MSEMIACVGCAKQLHFSAPACPSCGAVQKASSTRTITSYDQVPWFRKNWFGLITFFIMPLVLVGLLLSGPMYYEKKGELKTYTKTMKIFIFLWAIAQAIRFLGQMLKN